MCNHDNDSNCIKEILNVILVLQQNACPDSCLDSCDRPVLGGGPNCLVCNTRPIQLFTCSCCNTPLAMPTSKDSTKNCKTSTVFRVEKVDRNCCTCRVLEEDEDDSACTNQFIATNSFFTIDLGCVCAIRCLSDTFVECV